MIALPPSSAAPVLLATILFFLSLSLNQINSPTSYPLQNCHHLSPPSPLHLFTNSPYSFKYFSCTLIESFRIAQIPFVFVAFTHIVRSLEARMISSRGLVRQINLSATTKAFRTTKVHTISPIALSKPAYTVRPITCSTKLYKEDKRTPRAAERVLDSEPSHSGAFSRTDNTVQIEHPDESDHPPSHPIQGRGGMHFKRTLSSFSLEGGTAVVTGGARGLGLVMSQACMLSGADVAIVDLNSMWMHQVPFACWNSC